VLLPEWFDKADTAVKVALIAALASLTTSALTLLHSLFGAPLKYWLEKKALRHRLATEYEYQQRKNLRDLITKYRGRLVEAGEALNHRIWNFYRNEPHHWLDASGRYADSGYYFRSWAYRLLNVLAVARLFEKQAMFIDSRIAEKTDLDFIKYVKALGWAACDVSLFDGLNYPADRQTDHLFKDIVRLICDTCCADGNFLDQDAVHQVLQGKSQDRRYQSVHRFLDGLKRARWDRIVVIDLFVMAFLNTFGYETQHSTAKDFDKVVREIENEQILRNLRRWLVKLGLEKETGARLIVNAIEARLPRAALAGGDRPASAATSPGLTLRSALGQAEDQDLLP
jgi:hypothetical protein